MDRRTKYGVVTVLLFSSLFVNAASTSDAASFEVLDISKETLSTSYAYAISADGSVVVGRTQDMDGTQAFKLASSETSKLGSLDYEDVFSSKATAVSADGTTIVGNSNTTRGVRAFLCKNDSMIELGLSESNAQIIESFANSVSADGSVVVGYCHQIKDNFSGYEAFCWSDNKIINLGDLSNNTNHVLSMATDVSGDGSVIVGNAYNGESQEAFIYRDGKMTGLGFLIDTKYDPESYASAVSADGSVVVGYSTSLKGRQAFRWEDGKMVGLEFSDVDSKDCMSTAIDVSGDGSNVIGTYESSKKSGVFIWDSENGMRDLKELLEDTYGLELKGWYLVAPTAISADGKTIIGNGLNPDGITKSWIVKNPCIQ